MGQNKAKYHPTDAEWREVDATLDQLEVQCAPMLVNASADEMRRLVRMGDGSVAFCWRAADIMQDNVDLLPRNVDPAELRRDLETHDALNQRITRLTRLMERMRNTEVVLGSDAMVAGMEGYAFLRVAGKDSGLEALVRELGKRFEANGNRKPATGAAEVAG